MNLCTKYFAVTTNTKHRGCEEVSTPHKTAKLRHQSNKSTTQTDVLPLNSPRQSNTTLYLR